MPFGRHASLTARGDGPYGARALLLENVSAFVATEVAITFTGQSGAVELLDTLPIARVEPGQLLRLPLRRVRRDAAFRVAVEWQTEGGEPGRFFGVVTAGE